MGKHPFADCLLDPSPERVVPQDEERAIEEAWAKRNVPPDIPGSPWRVGEALHEEFVAGYRAALSTHPTAPKDVKRYIAWLCEGCDECDPPDGSERCQGPCNGPSLNGAEVVRAEDYDRLATAPEED